MIIYFIYIFYFIRTINFEGSHDRFHYYFTVFSSQFTVKYRKTGEEVSLISIKKVKKRNDKNSRKHSNEIVKGNREFNFEEKMFKITNC